VLCKALEFLFAVLQCVRNWTNLEKWKSFEFRYYSHHLNIRRRTQVLEYSEWILGIKRTVTPG